MSAQDIPGLDIINSALSLLLLAIGLICLLTQRNIIKQVIGLKIMLQGSVLALIQAGLVHDDMGLAQMMAISAQVVETIVIAIALALIINVFRHYPSGDIDHLDRLRG